VYRKAEGQPKSKLCWRPLRKGVADLFRRAKLSQAANETIPGEPAATAADQTLGDLNDPALPTCGVAWAARCGPLSPLSPADTQLLQAVSRGEFAISGFRNRDLRAILYGEAARTWLRVAASPAP